MRALVTLLAAGTLIGGCACTEMDLIGLPVENDGGVASEITIAVSPAAGERPVAGLRLYPGEVSDSMCRNFGDSSGAFLSIPCRDVINVCVAGADGSLSTKWMPAAFRCDGTSPSYETVCAVAPAEQWAFYGLNPDDCPTGK
jgi:hypothetical protein